MFLLLGRVLSKRAVLINFVGNYWQHTRVCEMNSVVFALEAQPADFWVIEEQPQDARVSLFGWSNQNCAHIRLGLQLQMWRYFC